MLRRVEAGDARLVWAWANNPQTRTMSFTPARISWDEHRSWFERKLADANCVWYLAASPPSRPVAQVRFEIDATGAALVSVSVAPDHRGRGYGASVLRAATSRLFAEAPGVRRVLARIRPENAASRSAFSRAGYAETATDGQAVRRDEVITMAVERERRDG